VKPNRDVPKPVRREIFVLTSGEKKIVGFILIDVLTCMVAFALERKEDWTLLIPVLLQRFYDVQNGSITIDGVDLNDVSQASLRRQLGVVPQEGFLFAGTVAENIAFGRPDATADEIVRAAQTVGAHEFILRLEDGYETQLGERGSRLSLGQRQLVAFARALLADPRILILDEATSSVDIGTERRIEQALRILLAERTAFIIARDGTIKEIVASDIPVARDIEQLLAKTRAA